MQVSELMTRKVSVVGPDVTIQHAAEIMAELDAGVVPVGEKDRLVGMLTDRDIAVRAIAKGKGPNAKVREVMSPEVKYCFEDQDIDEVIGNMGEIQVRRLPVINRSKRLVGILSLGDIAFESAEKGIAKAIHEISQPGGQHSQTG
jgi:CBS domain-containing protein